ncbi:MAG: SEC-C domain-containing protein, partial [Chloroflexi bacterium]|nr:SEC-C domain-containing protein [Chloroflexota bacterium]
GVDIKLGGELADEIIISVSRVLKKNGYADPYDMTPEEQLAALDKLNPADYGIYEAEVNFFRNQMADMVRVKEFGGLHVVGSERHEARRIDNQLRGRAARQGDPGSSRFYLSLEDELMSRFGGSNVSGLMERLKIDDSVPIAANIVSRVIEQSQSRVEGYNFDIRKHLLEYDDVLNEQRNKIYQQRDRIFTKDDLAEDLDEMLVAEIGRRVDLTTADEDGLWRLLEWTEQTQPPLAEGGELFPSYTVEILLRDLSEPGDVPTAKAAILRLAQESLQAEKQHLDKLADTLIDRGEERAEATAKERRERAETAMEGVELEAEESGKPVEARALVKAASDSIGIQIPPPNGRGLDLRSLKRTLADFAESTAGLNAAAHVIAGIERRTGLQLKIGQLSMEVDWADLRRQISGALESARAARAGRHLAEIGRELDEHLSRVNGGRPGRSLLARVLIEIAWGRQTIVDRRTHRTVTVRTQRLPLIFLAADKTADEDPESLKADLLEHFHGALAMQRQSWGEAELRRVATQPMNALDPETRTGLRRVLDDEHFNSMAETPVGSLDGATLAEVRDELGRQLSNGLHRQLMLQVSGQLWIDYLTAVEGLRTSVGLEAYAQRDPLIQYKSRAYDLFQELIVNMRAGVVSRLFTYRPRDLSTVQAEVDTARAASLPAQARTVGRNDPCWCGSGKKFKNCHGRSSSGEPAPGRETVAAQAAGAGTAAAVAESGGMSKSAKRRKHRQR